MLGRIASIGLALFAASAPLASPARANPATRPSETPMLSSAPTLVVRQFDFTGNTRFTDAELQSAVRSYLDHPITPEQLEQARVTLTRLYVDKGYLNSGAVLPDQPIEPPPRGSIVRVRIVEGRLSEVRVSFLQKASTRPAPGHRLRDQYVESRLRLGGRQPLNVLQLKDQLELLRQDPNIASVNAELRPGSAPGLAELDAAVRETNPFQLGAVFSNRRPPGVGSTALDLLASDRDLTGNGDLFSIRYDALYGEIDDMRFGQARDFSIGYAIPITPADTLLSFDYARTNALVVQEPFTALDITSKFNSYSVTLRQPIIRRPTVDIPAGGGWPMPAGELALFLSGAIRDDDTTLLGTPFDVLPGSSSGHSRVVALRFGQELSTRTAIDALSARSTFSFGLPILGATVHGDRSTPDSQFTSWVGQVQYVRRLGSMPALFGATPGRSPNAPGPGDVQLVLRASGQLASSPLLDVEQFIVGGVDTVRGYEEDQLVRDEGIAATAELHLPIVPGAAGQPDALTLVPFVDVGYARDLVAAGGPSAPNAGTDLNSVGLGLIFIPERRVNFQFYYGYALTHRDTSRRDPQDLGIHFNLTVLAF